MKPRLEHLDVPAGTPDGHVPTVLSGVLALAAPTGGSALHRSATWNVAAAGNNTLTLAATPYEESLQVFVDGLLKTPGTDYTVSGDVVTFATDLAAGQIVSDHYWTATASPADSILTTADFTPDTLAGLRAWLKVDAITGLVDTNPGPATWEDAYTTNADATKSGTVTYRTARTPLGGPALVFANAGQYAFGAAWAGMTAATLFLVVKNGAASNAENRGPWRFAGGDFSFYRYSDGKLYDGAFTNSRTSFTPSVSPESWRVFCITSGGGTYKAYLDNVQQVSAALAFSAPGSGAKLGESSTGWVGEIAEFIAYDSVLSSGDRGSVYNYLVDRHIA